MSVIIQKTIVQVTILHEAKYAVDGMTLADIGYEIDEGAWLGQTAIVSSEPVPPENLHDEQLALGNDGTFFGYDE